MIRRSSGTGIRINIRIRLTVSLRDRRILSIVHLAQRVILVRVCVPVVC